MIRGPPSDDDPDDADGDARNGHHPPFAVVISFLRIICPNGHVIRTTLISTPASSAASGSPKPHQHSGRLRRHRHHGFHHHIDTFLVILNVHLTIELVSCGEPFKP